MLKKGQEVEQESTQCKLYYCLGKQRKEKVHRSWPQLVSENVKIECAICFGSKYLQKASLLLHILPGMALANHHFLGTAPDVFKDLMVIEEAMIARCQCPA
jgi:hypothetical protein